MTATAKMVLAACDTYRKWCNRLAYVEAMRRAVEAALSAQRDADDDPALARTSVPEGWRPIESAPRDGTSFLAWTVHANARFSNDPVSEGWACVSVIRWIDHNAGGWTWIGLSGVHTHWQPLPAPPAMLSSLPGGDEILRGRT